ncbi:MAG: phosphoglucomutase/phosphomannomutase family protein [Candidatus Omnitrophica bacterium]|nr:phosphoglucomutase/phosphomannomutase family protein [Candidatus Omnitrophota bacterium]
MAKKQKKEIEFGTDGWRGVISDNFTYKNVAIVAQALCEWIKKDAKIKKGQKKVVAVGYDARFLSREYAEIVSSVLAKNNIGVFLSKDIIPTPALSYGVVDLKGVCGVMITASHNPAKFNGVKIKTAEGGGAGKDITDKVEKYLHKTPVKTMDYLDAVDAKKIILHDFKKSYFKFMRNYLDLPKLKSSKFKIIQDVMHGSGGTVLKDVLNDTSLDIHLMREDVNPSFEGVKPEPIEDYVPEILQRVKKEKFDIGLILDGDADRIAAVDSNGEYINPQRILALLTVHLVRNRGRSGGVVITTCGSMIMKHISDKLGLKLYETPVGFKYISDLMVNERIVAGGEEAGGMGVQDYIPERDGTLAGLLLVEMMVYQNKNIKQILDEMEKEFGRYYYTRSDLDLRGRKFDKAKIAKIDKLLDEKVVKVQTEDGVKLICEDESWLMLRPSGTEPLVRAYSEAKSLKKAKELLKVGESLLEK